MDTSSHMKEIEKKVYMSYNKDGIWDLVLGIWFLGTGVFFAYEMAYLMGAMAAVFIPVLPQVKKAVTLPRLGYVKFSPERQQQIDRGRKKLVYLNLVAVLMGLFAFIAFMGEGDLRDTFRNLGLIPFGILLSAMVGAVGLFYALRQFIFYAVLIMAVFVSAHFAQSHPAFYFLVPGVIFTVIGLVMLTRFLRRYPKSKREAHHGINS